MNWLEKFLELTLLKVRRHNLEYLLSLSALFEHVFTDADEKDQTLIVNDSQT